MANKINKNERFDKIRDKINKKPVAKKRVKNDDNVETSSFMSEIFPVVIVLCLLVGFGVFYFLFNTYKEVLVVDDDGYFLNTGTLILGSKKTENDADLIDFVAVNENDLIYKNALNHYVDDTKDATVNIQYPLFIDNGLSFINYNEDINLINHEFERSTGYSGLVLSYGRVFDLFDYTQIDKEKYLLLSYNDDVMINLYDLKISTVANEYFIPVNSFVYFEENSISYYERTDSGFVYKTIKDMSFESKMMFYYDSANEKYEYTYEDFLKGIDTIYIKDFIIDEPVTPDKPIEEVIPPVEKPDENVDTDQEFVWEKPSVIVSELMPSVYSMTGKLQIKDPAHVIVKEPTFTFYRNNKTFIRRTYYTSGDMKITGLIPATTFRLVGNYTYLASDMQTRIVVTFYSNDITTKDLSKLDPIHLSFKNGQIFPKKVEVVDTKVTSDLANEAISGVNRISLNIDDKTFYLSNNQVVDIINGRDTIIESPESLSSSSKIDYEFKFLDKEGNELKSMNSSGTTRTSKRLPNVSVRLKSSEIDSVTLGINVKNEDNIEFGNYIYVLKRSDGKIIEQKEVPDGDIVLTNLDPDQLFQLALYADIDIDDGRGVVKNTQLASIEFTSKPITTLGYVNLPMELSDVNPDDATIEYYINTRKTNTILIRLLQKLKFDLYNEDGSELVDSIIVEGEDIQLLKDGNRNLITFDNLKSFTKYKMVITTIIQQGSTVYELGTTQGLEEFMTKKLPAVVNITSPFTTETMIDFDISVDDVDGAITTDYVRLELRDKDNVIIDTKKIGINQDPERITYNNLNTEEFYNIYVYADGYNETHLNSSHKSKHLLVQTSAFTQSGISGKIELISSLRVPNSTNLVDVKSEVKWYQMYQTYNVAKTVDEDGNLHIYSKTGAGAYTYDLSDYHDEIVTASFKIKAKTPVNSNYGVYFTQVYSGSTSTSYGKKLTGITTDEFKEFKFTFRVGSYSRMADPSGIETATTFFTPYYDKAYGLNKLDTAGFYINGGTGTMSEYIIKDFEIHLQYDRVEYPIGDITYEQGGWNSNKAESTAKTTSSVRTRISKPILLEGGKRYSFEYDNDNNYKLYFYLMKPDGTYEKAYGWGNSSYTFYVPQDRYIRVMFNYRGDAGTISPDDIKNFRIYQYKKNDVESDPEFEYDLVTKAKVTVTDKLDQIQTNDYFIKIYENGEEIASQRYEELIDDVYELNDIVKEIDLDEQKEYLVELGFNYKERYYPLSNFEISTKDEVKGISTTNDWYYIQPYGNYIFLNDIDFTNYTDRRIGDGYRYFHGVIDFQGYRVRQSTQKTDGSINSNYYRIYRIETDAVLKNLVLDVQLNNKDLHSNVYGFIHYNYGTVENLILEITDTKNTQLPQKLLGLLTYQNGVRAKVNNFVVKLNGDVHYYAESSLLVRENYGKITNGYMYGGDVIVDFSLISGTSRNLGLFTRKMYSKGVIENVFSTVSYKFPNNAEYDYGGIFASINAGTINNVYAYGDANPNYPSYGPLVRTTEGTSKISNAYYISDNIYTPTYQSKASLASLNDATFQKNLLGDAFNVDEMISLGYYPQLKFSSNKMPNQDYIELPVVNEEYYADIVFMDVLKNNSDSARIKVTVDNPLGEEITDISIANLTTEIEEQTFKDGKSEVIIKVSNPSVFTSKYAVNSITSISPNGFKSTRKYQSNELFLRVDLFRKIYTVDEFIRDVNKYNTQNFLIMNDLDFSGYTNFYVSTFGGIIDGNNHTISNVSVKSTSNSGLFGTVNGHIKNLFFENIYKSSKTTYHGVFGTASATASFENVHVSNMTIEIKEDMNTSGMMVGGLLGRLYQGSMSYCSATDVTITTESEAQNLSLGGLVGKSYGGFINNSYAQNVDINVNSAISAYGVGGLVGYEEVSNGGSIDHCYSTGTVTTNTTNSGGLVGRTNGYVDGSYSSVDVVSYMSFIGGITGRSYAKGNIVNSLYLGNLYSSSVDQYIHRISGNYEAMDSNFAMDTNLINGTLSSETYGEQLRTYQDYFNADTYREVLDEISFDFSKSSEGVLPKLYASDGETLLPNQRDNYLYKNMFNIKNMVMEKHADDAAIVLTLDNPDNYQITEIKVKDAFTEIERNVTQNNETQIQFELRPEKYLDSYRISEITYLDENGNEQKLSRNIKIEAVFYKSLAKFEDWQKVSNTIAENYLLEADIDFTDKDDINTNVMFNRLEVTGTDAQGNPLTHTLKGIDLTYKSNGNYHVLIQKVSTALKNVNFEDINITDTSTSTSYNYVGLIMYNYGELDNLSFKDITVDAKYKNYVGPISVNYGYSINDITLENVTVSGRTYVGGFVAYASNTSNDSFKNIHGKNMNITASTQSVGGLFGHFPTNVSVSDNPPYRDMSVEDSHINGTAKYVGGVVGYGPCSYCTVNNTTVHGKEYVGGVVGYQVGDYNYWNEVNDSHISGTAYYIGGVYGHTRYNYNMYLNHSTVEGTGATTHSVGGIAGYRSGYGVLYRSGVLDSTITNAGDRTGGIYGRTNGDARIYNTYVVDTNITGTNRVGGAIGEQYEVGRLYDSIISRTNVTANENFAGGIVGYYYNNSDYGAYAEGYVTDMSAENVHVSANHYAGGIFGGTYDTLYYGSRVRKNYFDGTVTSKSGINAGFGTGDSRNLELIRQPRTYFYENSLLNGQPIKETVGNPIIDGVNLLENTVYSPGYITSGKPTYDPNDINASYTDFIELKAGKTYFIDVEYIKNPTSAYDIFLYSADKVYVSSISSSSADPYIGFLNGVSGYDEMMLTVYRNCFIRINITNKTRIDNIAMYNVTKPNSIESKYVLNYSQLREPITWVNAISTTTNNTVSRLAFDTTYYTVDPVIKARPNISVTDKSAKKLVASGKVGAISTDGVLFDASTDNQEALQIMNYDLPSDTFTLSTKFNVFSSRNYAPIFNISKSSSLNGFGLFVHALQLYVLVNSEYKATGYYVPYGTDSDVTVTFNNKKVIVYLNGQKVYEYTSKSLPATTTSYETFIGYNRYRNGVNVGHNFVGRIQNVMLFNRVLSADEILDNYTSSSITNESDLDFYFDFTDTGISYETSYPMVKTNSSLYGIAYQREIPMPVADTTYENLPMNLSYSLNSPLLPKYVDVYSSGIDTINLEFKEISRDLSFVYRVNGKEYKTNVDKKVYTLQYDYVNDFEIELITSHETKKLKYTRNDVARNISIYDNNYYHIDSDMNLYKNDDLVINEAVNIIDNLVLLKDGKLYNLSTKDYQVMRNKTGILNSSIPLDSNILNGKSISTYYNYSLIDNEEFDGQMFIKDNHAFIFNTEGTINNNIVYGLYNTDEYQIVLRNDGTLKSYKSGIKFPSSFVNKNIKEITFDKYGDSSNIMIKYESDNVLVFNYITGEEIFKSGNNIPATLFEYLGSSLSPETNSLLSISPQYEESKKFMDSLDNADINNVNDIIDQYVTTDNSTSKLLDSEYVSVYNSSTNKFDIYNVNEIVTSKKDKVSSDEEDETVVKDSVKKYDKDTIKLDVKPVNSKVKSNFVLYNYFDGNNDSSVKDNRTIIYMFIIGFVIINLFILSYVYSRKEKSYEK